MAHKSRGHGGALYRNGYPAIWALFSPTQWLNIKSYWDLPIHPKRSTSCFHWDNFQDAQNLNNPNIFASLGLVILIPLRSTLFLPSTQQSEGS